MNNNIPTELVAPLFNPATFGIRGAVDDILRQIRLQYPLAVAEVPGFDPHWIVSRHADVADVSRRNEEFASSVRSATLAPVMGEEMVKQFTQGDPNLFHSLVQMDGEEHRSHRQVTTPFLNPKSVREKEPEIRELASHYVKRVLDSGGELDWAKDVAAQFPLEVVMNLVGVPKADHPQMLRLTQWLFSWADPDLGRPDCNPMDPEQQARSWKMIFDEFSDYFLDLTSERRKNPREDIASLIAMAEFDGQPMTDWNAVSYFAILATAGHDSSAHTISTGMWELAETPALWAQLKSEPGLIPAFVNESIRWATPVKQFVRTATRDTTLAERKIREGDRVYLAYPSANRDESVFEDPYTFRLDRKVNKQLSFGFGGHVCLGQHLARIEMKCLWEELLPRVDSVTMAGEGRLIHSEFVSGPKSVPIKAVAH
ncbi:MAG: cytochrome P450 [Pseudomonadota bacterium]